jgi:hypothetical protein
LLRLTAEKKRQSQELRFFRKDPELAMLGETVLPPELLPFIPNHDDPPEHTAFREDDALPLPGIENIDVGRHLAFVV